jgi:16S rRNA G966 N2-methylase RsmD
VAADPDVRRVQKLLAETFPGGESEYRSWFLRTIGIVGDPVNARKAIRTANEAGIKLADGGYGYARAFTVSPDSETVQQVLRLATARGATGTTVRLLDPFAGGGSIPFEAARYGLDTVANELNPVAAAILQGTVSLPATLGLEFAALLKKAGAEWASRVEDRLAPYYPKVEHGESIVAYVWAHTVPCPTTGLPTPLTNDFWVARGKAGRNIAVKFDANRATGQVTRAIVEGPKAAEWGNRVTYKDGTGRSVWTGETFGGDYIRKQASNMSWTLLAVAVTRPGQKGRQFRVPFEAELVAADEAEAELQRRIAVWQVAGLVPDEEIDAVSNYDRGHRMYGIYCWSDFFTPRQLLGHLTALEELHNVVNEVGGRRGTGEQRALGLYLGFALDKAVDYSSRQASWDATRLKVRDKFDKHNYAFKWSFAEFDAAHSLIPWAVQQVVDAYEGMAKLAYRPESILETEARATAEVLRESATNLSLNDGSVDVIVTDPPYGANVMYAECSDYFYVWLKRSLRYTWPELVVLALTDKASEAVENKALYKPIAGAEPSNGPTADELAGQHYQRLMSEAFGQARRVLTDDGVLTVMFTHTEVETWDKLGHSLLSAGFSINSSWPVHTESEHSTHQARKNAASSTILLTCRKRGATASAYWVDLRPRVAAAARDAARQMAADGLVGIDLTLATFGPVLSVLSENWPVFTGDLDADGNPVVLRPDAALDLAREEVASLKKRGLLGGRDVEFDRVTDWYLLAWSDFAAAGFPVGEALKLSIATHLDLEDLSKRHRIVRAASGTVTLLTPAQRRTAKVLDPDAASWSTLVDALHALMLTYDEDGLPAARAWLDRTGKRDDQRFVALVSGAIQAIPRVKEKGEFVRPEARMLEGLRATLFEQIPPPADRGEPDVAQTVLLE